jgi:hypothetical protein
VNFKDANSVEEALKADGYLLNENIISVKRARINEK